MNPGASAHHIGDVAKHVGLSPRAVRYYEEMGLIRPMRTEGGFRLYSDHDVDVLKLIVHFKDLGMSLEEIRGLFSAEGSGVPRETSSRLRETLLKRREDFELRACKCQEAIEQIDRALRLLAACTDCGAPADRPGCTACMRNRGSEGSPLLDSLFEGPETISMDGRRTAPGSSP